VSFPSIKPSLPPPAVYEGHTAIVLSGGGARGAYEAGVLRYVFGEFARRHGTPTFDIVSGTSVGAINGAFLGSVSHEPVEGIARLTELWSMLELDRVLGFGVLQAAKLPRVLFGGRQGAGLFDVSPLIRIVSENMRWADLARNLRKGRLQAITVSATHVATGRPWCFVDRAPGMPLPDRLPPMMTVKAERIGPHHVLASAAIPVLFPPVPVNDELFVDGGLRLNTPMSPALHMGARRVLVIGLTTSPNTPAVPAFSPGVFPGIAFLLGKVLNAFLLDHVNADFYELERVNRILDDGVALFGPEFVTQMNARAVAENRPTRHRVHAMVVHPSEDIGRLAAAHLRTHQARFGKLLGRSLLRILDLGQGADADLVSYLLFDGDFARQLMELGERDARRRESDLVRFFWGEGKAVEEAR
jgi:NTE family protein